jgi:hypothetical protein
MNRREIGIVGMMCSCGVLATILLIKYVEHAPPKPPKPVVYHPPVPDPPYYWWGKTAYESGVKCAENGLPVTVNPYMQTDGSQAKVWLDGYLSVPKKVKPE